MKVLKVKFSEKSPTRFYVYVWGPDEYRWKECHYAFSYDDQKIYFLIGGQEKDKKLVGQANSKEEGVKKATEYLEGWLKECKAIGNLQKLRIQKEDNRGKGYFTLQVWAADKKEKIRRDTLFTFNYEDKKVYFLGNDAEIKNELIGSANDKEESVTVATDYLEWQLSEQGRL